MDAEIMQILRSIDRSLSFIAEALLERGIHCSPERMAAEEVRQNTPEIPESGAHYQVRPRAGAERGGTMLVTPPPNSQIRYQPAPRPPEARGYTMAEMKDVFGYLFQDLIIEGPNRNYWEICPTRRFDRGEFEDYVARCKDLGGEYDRKIGINYILARPGT